MLTYLGNPSENGFASKFCEVSDKMNQMLNSNIKSVNAR